mmetsp:Transcript_14785/g.47987  ORF Transcript_14785/g.47987 Transcript_14785/m.47987 type:complete len:238 (+) Transcript_14785:257-970(+)
MRSAQRLEEASRQDHRAVEDDVRVVVLDGGRQEDLEHEGLVGQDGDDAAVQLDVRHHHRLQALVQLLDLDARLRHLLGAVAAHRKGLPLPLPLRGGRRVPAAGGGWRLRRPGHIHPLELCVAGGDGDEVVTLDLQLQHGGPLRAVERLVPRSEQDVVGEALHPLEHVSQPADVWLWQHDGEGGRAVPVDWLIVGVKLLDVLDDPERHVVLHLDGRVAQQDLERQRRRAASLFRQLDQ